MPAALRPSFFPAGRKGGGGRGREREGEGTNPEAEDLKRSQGACKTATTTADPRHHQVQRHKVDRGEIISGNPQKIIPDILHREKNVHPLGDFFLALLFPSPPPLHPLAAARASSLHLSGYRKDPPPTIIGRRN